MGQLVHVPRAGGLVYLGRPDFDFETRSPAGYRLGDKVVSAQPGKAGGLALVGTHVYAEHPQTEVLSLYYDLKDGAGRRHWLPGAPPPQALLDWVARGGEIEAHHLAFEFLIWHRVCMPRYGWPVLRLSQCYCSMAKALRYGIPAALDEAAKVRGTLRKDPRGDDLLRKLSRPHTPTKKRAGYWRTPETDPDMFDGLYAYNEVDIMAETELSETLPELTPYERAMWLVDQRVNMRGIRVDVEALRGGTLILRDAERKYGAELAALTGGEVTAPTELEGLKAWLAGQGVYMENMQAETVEAAAKRTDLPPAAARAIQIRALMGSANVTKLRAMSHQTSFDGRLRGQYRYCGASQTGRWSAQGVQLQNITSGGPRPALCESCGHHFAAALIRRGCPRCGAAEYVCKVEKEWHLGAIADGLADMRSGSLVNVEAIWGEAVPMLAGCLRSLLQASPGKKLVCADYTAVEAVAAACISGCQWRIDVFRDPSQCIYTRTASDITGKPYQFYVEHKRQHGSDHPDRKKLGKIAELASAYGGWVNAWVNFGCELPEEEIKQALRAWRKASPEIVETWGGQYRKTGPHRDDVQYSPFGLEGCSILAIQNPGQVYRHNCIAYKFDPVADVLLCRLPSGRYIRYHRPRLEPNIDRFYKLPSQMIVFEGVNTNSAKGSTGWQVRDTFGGREFENVCQASCADLQGEALVRADPHYPIVLHTHDELCAEVDDSPRYTAAGLAALMIPPKSGHWASDWPLRAVGWEHKLYHKD